MTDHRPIPAFTRTQIRDFWMRVTVVPSGCWEWRGSLNHNGYGRFTKQKYLAHRVAWALLHDDPGELSVLHKCDNPRCVWDRHLFLGTDTDNSADAVAKGRKTGPPTHRQGSAHWKAKLTEAQVLDIRSRAELGYRQLAREFNVSPETIGCIVRRETWTHI